MPLNTIKTKKLSCDIENYPYVVTVVQVAMCVDGHRAPVGHLLVDGGSCGDVDSSPQVPYFRRISENEDVHCDGGADDEQAEGCDTLEWNASGYKPAECCDVLDIDTTGVGKAECCGTRKLNTPEDEQAECCGALELSSPGTERVELRGSSELNSSGNEKSKCYGILVHFECKRFAPICMVNLANELHFCAIQT